MKKILIICGTGVATSTVVMIKLKNWIAEKGYGSRTALYQAKVADALTKIDDYDIIVSTTIVPDNVKDKVINGLALITGINAGEVLEKIEEQILKGE